MAFILDATPGSLTANSYVDLSQAEDYFSARFGSDNWDDLTSTEKEKVLAHATRRIDAEYFGGQKSTNTQALQWPRRFTFDKDGFPRPAEVLPKELMYATCELALHYVSKDDRELTDSMLDDMEEVKIGPLGYKIKKGRSGDQLPQTVDRFLRSIGPSAWAGKRFPSHLGR